MCDTSESYTIHMALQKKQKKTNPHTLSNFVHNKINF